MPRRTPSPLARPVQLFEGVTLWREARPFVDRQCWTPWHAAASARRDRQRLLHVVVAVVAGLVGMPQPRGGWAVASPATNSRAAVISAAGASGDATGRG